MGQFLTMTMQFNFAAAPCDLRLCADERVAEYVSQDTLPLDELRRDGQFFSKRTHAQNPHGPVGRDSPISTSKTRNTTTARVQP